MDYREKKNKPLKNPLKELVVVHTDKDFLADIEGKLYLLTQCIMCTLFSGFCGSRHSYQPALRHVAERQAATCRVLPVKIAAVGL